MRTRAQAGAAAAAVALLGALAWGSTGCHSRAPVRLSGQWPSRPGDYTDVTDTWTRHATDHTGLGGNHDHLIQQTLDVYATFKSPEWLAAWIRYQTGVHRLPATEVDAMTTKARADFADHYEIELLVATYDRRSNDLSKGSRSSWRVALVDDGGNEIVASEILRDRRPRAVVRADYPHIGDFHQPYIARFPHKVELLREGARRFSLKVTSDQGGVVLDWDDGK